MSAAKTQWVRADLNHAHVARFTRSWSTSNPYHRICGSRIVRRKMGPGGFEPREHGRSLRSRCVFSLSNPCNHTNGAGSSFHSSQSPSEVGPGGFEPRGLHFARPLGSNRHAIRSSRPFVAEWVRADLNHRPRPCKGHVITNLDHGPASEGTVYGEITLTKGQREGVTAQFRTSVRF